MMKLFSMNLCYFKYNIYKILAYLQYGIHMECTLGDADF